MFKFFSFGLLLGLALLLVNCSTFSSYSAYSESMFQGKQLLRTGNYPLAKREFLKAAQSSRDAESLSFAATAAYKAQDTAEAARLIAEAEKAAGPKNSSLRVEGYKTLIYFSEGKNEAGFRSLNGYLQLYDTLYPMESIREVRRMHETRRVNVERLEVLMDQQIVTTEDEMEKLRTNAVGFMDRGGMKGP